MTAHSRGPINPSVYEEFHEWLLGRDKFFANEISRGGDFEHLNTRRQEAAYLRQQLERAIARAATVEQVTRAEAEEWSLSQELIAFYLSISGMKEFTPNESGQQVIDKYCERITEFFGRGTKERV